MPVLTTKPVVLGPSDDSNNSFPSPPKAVRGKAKKPTPVVCFVNRMSITEAFKEAQKWSEDKVEKKGNPSGALMYFRCKKARKQGCKFGGKCDAEAVYWNGVDHSCQQVFKNDGTGPGYWKISAVVLKLLEEYVLDEFKPKAIRRKLEA